MKDEEESPIYMENEMNSIARNDEYLCSENKNNELIIIENNSVFVNTTGLSDSAQLNIM
jgi:hypothetical protein